MIFAKGDKYGLELQVYFMQKTLDRDLPWLGTINIYNLLFKNAKNDSYILEAWTGEDRLGREYKQVFNQDTSTAQIGFVEVSRDVKTSTAEVDVICTVDLEKAYNQQIRDNQRAYLEFKHVLRKVNKVIGFARGIDNVFSGLKIEDIKYLDIQPYDVFRYRVIMSYSDYICQ